MDIYLLNVLFSLFFVACYCFVSVALGSFLNAFTPFFIITLASRYILDLAYFSIMGIVPDLWVYFSVYLTTAIDFFCLLLGFFLFRRGVLSFSFFTIKRPLSLRGAWYVLFFSYIIFSPVLLGNLDLLFSPRDLYTATRTGYGPLFFGSLIVAYVSFVIFLFSEKTSVFSVFCYLAFLVVNFLLHGNKSPLVVVFFMYIVYSTVVVGRKYSVFGAMKVGFSIAVLIVGLFLITLSDSMKEDLILGISGYSDFNRNFALVVQNPPEQTYGKLTLEGQVWPLIPRFVYPDKPKNFGTFFLAEHYFPAWFDADTGSPAFGFGVSYADFREMNFLYVGITSLLIGLLLRVFYNRLQVYKSPSDFIMVVFLSGTPVVEFGSGYQIIPHLLLAGLIMMFLKMRFFSFSSRRPSLGDGGA